MEKMKYNSVLVVVVFALFIIITSGNEVKMGEAAKICDEILFEGYCHFLLCKLICNMQHGKHAFSFCFGMTCRCYYAC
ncbi:hypothetical protein M5689_008165 [Euphorbia peplus]|nr:hypothetical protein M5689_008165 [Euphorbia peplus]